MNPFLEHLQHQTRRHFLQAGGVGIGGVALASLIGSRSEAAEANAASGQAAGDNKLPEVVNPLKKRDPHFAGKAKRVIYLHLTGSPRPLRLQAAARQTRRARRPGIVPERETFRLHHGDAEAAGDAA
jgi:hypothetical protein